MKRLKIISSTATKAILSAAIALASALFFNNINAQNIHSVSTCPGEDCSNEMIISWGADTSVQSRLLWWKASERKAKSEMPVSYRTEIYNGRSSKRANNENFSEEVIFTKCRVKLAGLEPNTTYHYVIIRTKKNSTGTNATDNVGTKTTSTITSSARTNSSNTTSDTSQIYTFKTAGASEWSACVISDFHNYSPIPARLEAADKMITKIKEYDPSMDWVLHLGDVCAWGGSYSFWKNLYGMKWYRDYMWAGVNGNHDNMSRKYELTNEYFRNSSAYPMAR